MSATLSSTRSRRGFTLLEIMIIVGIIGILVAIAVPAWLRARSHSSQRACQENMQKIDGAKQQWALETRQVSTATPVDGDLFGDSNYVRRSPACPAGGSYTIANLVTRPSCTQSTDASFPHVFILP